MGKGCRDSGSWRNLPASLALAVAMLASACAATGAATDARKDAAEAPAAYAGNVIEPAQVLPTGSVLFWSQPQQIARYPVMEQHFRAREIKRGDKVNPLPKAAAELSVSYDVGGETWTTETFMTRNHIAGLLVLKDGKILLERYGLGHGPDKRWTSFSVAKSMSSTMVGAAIRDGKIKSLEDPVTQYLPGLAGSGYEGVTVRHLLTMTSGVKWNEDYADPKSDVALFSAEPSVNGSDPVVTYMARLPREAEPGTKWVYKTGETNLVGSLVIAATGKSMAQNLSEKVWSRIGMEQDAIWMIDAAGNEVAGCCISATLKDYGRFAQFFMQGARVDGASIVPDGWVKEATASTPEARAGMGQAGGYGYQWWTTPGPAYRGSGIFGQQMWINPELNLVVILQGAWPVAGDPGLASMRQGYLDAVESAVKGGS